MGFPPHGSYLKAKRAIGRIILVTENDEQIESGGYGSLDVKRQFPLPASIDESVSQVIADQ
jgi:hypothetical protein